MEVEAAHKTYMWLAGSEPWRYSHLLQLLAPISANFNLHGSTLGFLFWFVSTVLTCYSLNVWPPTYHAIASSLSYILVLLLIFFYQSLSKLPGLALSLESSFLNFLSSWTTDLYHQAQLIFSDFLFVLVGANSGFSNHALRVTSWSVKS